MRLFNHLLLQLLRLGIMHLEPTVEVAPPPFNVILCPCLCVRNVRRRHYHSFPPAFLSCHHIIVLTILAAAPSIGG